MTAYRVPYSIPFYTQSAAGYAENGFASLDEAREWEDRCCGVVSLKMIADGLLPAVPPVKSLITQGVSMGAYIPGKGWIHYKLAELGQSLGLCAAAHRGMALSDLAASIEAGHPCIISVSPFFTGGEKDENGCVTGKGGHLVVALGTVRENGILTALTVHHPSVHQERNRAFWDVPIEAAERSFGGNYIEFQK